MEFRVKQNKKTKLYSITSEKVNVKDITMEQVWKILQVIEGKDKIDYKGED